MSMSSHAHSHIEQNMKSDTSRTLLGLHENDAVVVAAILATYIGVVAYGLQFGSLGLAIGGGAVILALSWLTASMGRGGGLSQVALPTLGMAMVALMIHVGHGHTEAHFGVFAFLACLVAYRATLPIIAGAAAIAVHHLSFNYFQEWGWGPICFTEPSFMRVVEHAMFVVVETVVLLLLAARMAAAFRTAEELTSLVDRLQTDDDHVDLSIARHRSSDPRVQRFVAAVQHIAESVKLVQQSSEEVRMAAGEIASGNASLSARTEQAASSIQETAASVEEIASSIQASSGNAHSANQLSREASEVAAAGGDAVSRVVSTMSDIQSSSRKITDIIGVIDGIAFQTNILALNAAVEAARAGEQGRGFAVVAAEVRTLARRSADAAKEIKQLITNSVDQVESGSSLVNTTGATISEVVDQVRRVNELVGLIASTSSEQNNGINQINQAVSNLDQATQHNAALVEQTAAAAESLRHQSDALSRAVSVFRLA